MKKLLIAAAVVIVAIFIYKEITDVKRDSWAKNEVYASYNSDAIQEPVSAPDSAFIYIDASGSMKPYFLTGDTSMINTISEIKNLAYEQTQILFLGNDKPYSGLVKNIITDVKAQPNMVATTFDGFFKSAAARIDSANEMLYLVTDGIMSIGPGNTQQALVQLRGQITSALKGHPDLAAAIFRYTGKFKGNYWNYKNQTLTVKDEITRPYYVIALGRKAAVRWLQKEGAAKVNNPEGELFMGVHDFVGHAKTVMSKTDTLHLQNRGQEVKFILDLPACLQSINPAKVKVIHDNNVLPVNVTKEGNRLTATIPPVTVLRPDPTTGIITVTFCADREIEPADWIGEWSTDNDLEGPDDYTTFGLKELVQGMYNALEGPGNYMQAKFVYLP